MTPSDGERATQGVAVLTASARTELTITRAAHWDGTERVLVRRDGRAVFACLAASRPGATWFVTQCLPQRRDPGSAALLLAVCDHLAAESGATGIVTICPAFWGTWLAASGARTLRRIIPMSLRLDEDLLLIHARSLPGLDQPGCLDQPGLDRLGPVDRLSSLDMPADGPARLARLAADDQRDGDLIVWREICSGVYGPVITEASLQVSRGAETSAAIAVTEYLGSPLIAHLVTAPAERGGGLGKALLVQSLLRLSDCGYVECHLNVAADNWIAHRLYRSIGFTQAGPELLASWVSREAVGDEQ